MEDSATTDRGLLGAAYAASDKLATRVALYDHQRPRIDLPRHALGRLTLGPTARVLDLGCGYGRYLGPLAEIAPAAVLVGADLSAGMVREARAQVPAALPIVADAQEIPVASASCDAVLAMHMLYHVPDIERAVVEARRALRPGGTLLVSTNGREHLRPLYDLVEEVVEIPLPGVTDRFTTDDVPILEAVFDDVTQETLRAEVVVTDPRPVRDFVDSGRDLREPLLPSDLGWEDLLDRVDEHVAAVIERHGGYRLPTAVTVFACA